MPPHLDLILISSLSHVSKHNQYPADAFSFHDMLFLSYKICPLKAKLKVSLLQNFEGMDLECLHQVARNLNWSAVIDGVTIDDKVEGLNRTLTQLCDIQAPVRPVKLIIFLLPGLPMIFEL